MAVETRTQADGSVVYFARYKDPRGKKRKEAVRTVPPGSPKVDHDRARKKADAYAADQRALVRNDEWRPPEVRDNRRGLPFHLLVKRFLAEYETRSGDMTHYEMRAKQWLDHFDKIAVDQIGVTDIDRFKKKRAEVVSPSTVKKDLTALSTLFEWARVRGLVQRNPAHHLLVRRPSEPKRKPAPLTEAQELALRANARPWLLRLIDFWLFTGADRQDTALLTWNQVDPERMMIDIPRGKTGVAREIYYRNLAPVSRVLKSCEDALTEFATKGKQLDTQNRVFLSDRGEPLTVDMIKAGLRRLYIKCGFWPEAGPCRVFRHTFAARLRESGAPRDAQRFLMGHGDRQMTDVYGKPSAAYLESALAGLSAHDPGEKCPTMGPK